MVMLAVDQHFCIKTSLNPPHALEGAILSLPERLNQWDFS